MTELDELLDNLKDSIISLLDKAKDESFRAGIQEGINQAKEKIKNALDFSDYPLQPKKKKVRGKKKPKSVTEKEITTRENYGKLKEFILNLEPGKYMRNHFINEGFPSTTITRNLIKVTNNPKNKFRKLKRGVYIKESNDVIVNEIIKNELVVNVNDASEDKFSKKEIIRKFLLDHEDGSFNADYVAEKVGFNPRLISDYMRLYFLKDCELRITKQVNFGRKVIYNKSDVPQRIEEKEIKKPDEDEVEMNLKIISEEREKEIKPKKVIEKAIPLEKVHEQLVKECLDEAETINEAIELFKNKSGNKNSNIAKKRFYKFKELIKESGLGEKCSICNSKIKEEMSDGNVCRNCRNESQDFRLEEEVIEDNSPQEWDMGTHNRRCRECGKGKPKSAFPAVGRICRACRS